MITKGEKSMSEIQIGKKKIGNGYVDKDDNV